MPKKRTVVRGWTKQMQNLQHRSAMELARGNLAQASDMFTVVRILHNNNLRRIRANDTARARRMSGAAS